MSKVVFLSGAGVSQESGLKTFRDMDGLWEEYDVMDVCTPEAWERNPVLVNEFYNQRRKQLINCKPNKAHELIAELEKWFEVSVITQNVDNLHEKAGSTNVLHLHGELTKARSTVDENYIIDLKEWELKLSDKCPKGAQLRPHIVWFGKAVPAFDEAIEIVNNADILVVIGTSLNVYPAAGLVNYIKEKCKVYVIDPETPKVTSANVEYIAEKATIGMNKLTKILLKTYIN